MLKASTSSFVRNVALRRVIATRRLATVTIEKASGDNVTTEEKKIDNLASLRPIYLDVQATSPMVCCLIITRS